jgi:hypothetical protein
MRFRNRQLGRVWSFAWPALRRRAVIAAILTLTTLGPAQAQNGEVVNIRGKISAVDGSTITVQTKAGTQTRLKLTAESGIFALSRAVFSDVYFGTYVGAVSTPLPDGWTHRAFELRVIDEQLRGLALGHMKWDLTAESGMTHGWVDDIEDRILSIKFGPTDEEERDVEVPRDVPIQKMEPGDKNLLKTGLSVFAGVSKDASGGGSVVFLIAGRDGIEPGL